MKKFCVVLGIVWAAIPTLQAATSPEQPLAVGQVFIQQGDYALLDTLNVWVGYQPADIMAGMDAPLFENYTLTEADVGRTLTATAATDPDFPRFVSLLTNGRNDFVMTGSSGYGNGQFESLFWIQRPPGNNGRDLAGFQVGRITLTIDTLTIESPGSDPNGNGYWTDRTFLGRVSVFTLVPEPTTLTVLSLGAFAWSAGRLGARRKP